MDKITRIQLYLRTPYSWRLRHLDIAEATVKTYLRGVFTRLDVSSRAEAVAVGLRLGLIE